MNEPTRSVSRIPPSRDEPTDVPARPILLLAGSLIALVALASWVGSALVHRWSPASEEPPSASYRRVIAPVEPRLQVEPRKDLAELRRKEDAELHRKGADPGTGVLRIPIEEAMSRIVERAGKAREEKP